MISSATVTVLRRIARQGMTETCDLYAADKTIDATGAVNNGVILQQAGVACRLIDSSQSMSSTVRSSAGQEQLLDELRLILPYGTQIDTDYEVQVGERRYQIVRIEDDFTDTAFVSCTLMRRR